MSGSAWRVASCPIEDIFLARTSHIDLFRFDLRVEMDAQPFAVRVALHGRGGGYATFPSGLARASVDRLALRIQSLLIGAGPTLDLGFIVSTLPELETRKLAPELDAVLQQPSAHNMMRLLHAPDVRLVARDGVILKDEHATLAA